MNTRSKVWLAISSMLILVMLLAACGTPTPEVIEKIVTQEVEVEKVVTQEVEKIVTQEVVKEIYVTPTAAPTTRKGGWLDEIVFSVVSNASAITQLQAAAIDIYGNSMSSADLPDIEAAGLSYADSSGSYYELTFNPVGPEFPATGALNPFSSVAVREAMNWLIDRDYINQEIYGGGSLPKFFPITTGFPDYTDLVDVARALENKYAYNPELAEEIITAEMEAMGAEMVDGKWTYNGDPVTIIFLIRNDSDMTRIPMGDYVANQLEDIGFTVDRQYKTSSEASPLWVMGDPADGQWHIYTGAWSATAINRDMGYQFQFFYSPASSYGFSPLWQAYDLSDEFTKLCDDLYYNRFNSLEERREAFARALEISFNDQNGGSTHVWVIDGRGYTPFNTDVEVGYDLAAGVDGSQIWPYTLRFVGQEGGRMNWGQPDLFVDPWNAIAGSNWAFDHAPARATETGGYMLDPYTGLYRPFKMERADITAREGLPVGKTLDWVSLEFSPEIAVPGDAWVDWDPVEQRFITADEKFPDGLTSDIKSVVYYPEDLFETTKWHDGSNLSVGDFVMSMIQTFDQGMEGSAIYDESMAGNLASFMSIFKGYRIVSTDPLVIETYNDGFYLDAELNVTTLFPKWDYGEASWPILAISNMADAAGDLAYSADKADTNEIEWLSWIGGPSLDILNGYLETAIAETPIPYEPTLGEFITTEEAQTRYQNLKNWYDTMGHFWVGTGPYFLDKVFLTEKTLTLRHFADYPDLANRWSTFGTPAMAEVELDGPGQVTIGQEAVYDVFATFQGEPYPQKDIKMVKVILFDATNTVVYVGEAETVADGQYQAVLPADVTATLEAGANKLEVAVVPLPVAVPTFAALEFITVP